MISRVMKPFIPKYAENQLRQSPTRDDEDSKSAMIKTMLIVSRSYTAVQISVKFRVRPELLNDIDELFELEFIIPPMFMPLFHSQTYS